MSSKVIVDPRDKSDPKTLHFNLKPYLQRFTNPNLRWENESKDNSRKTRFFSFAQLYMKNHISSYLSSKLIKFIPLENTFNELQLSRKHHCKIQNASQSNSSLKLLLYPVKDRTGTIFQSILKNHHKLHKQKQGLKFTRFIALWI